MLGRRRKAKGPRCFVCGKKPAKEEGLMPTCKKHRE